MSAKQYTQYILGWKSGRASVLDPKATNYSETFLKSQELQDPPWAQGYKIGRASAEAMKPSSLPAATTEAAHG